MPRPAAITFDVYGTLTQWDQALAAAMGDILNTHEHSEADVKLAASACNAEALRLEAIGAFRSYRAILLDALRPALATAGLAPTPADEEMLIHRLSRVPPFPEVPSVLAELGPEPN